MRYLTLGVLAVAMLNGCDRTEEARLKHENAALRDENARLQQELATAKRLRSTGQFEGRGATDEQEQDPTTSLPSAEGTKPKDPFAAEGLTVSQAMAWMMAGCVEEMNLHPEKNAVDGFATVCEWPRIEDELARLSNAKVAYQAAVSGHNLWIGHDGTSSIVSIGVGAGFDRAEAIRTLRETVVLTPLTEFPAVGQHVEFMRVTVGRRDLGVLIVNSGTSSMSKGFGSISFMTKARADKEGLASSP